MRSLVVLVVLATASVAAAAPDPARIERAADRVLDGRYQGYGEAERPDGPARDLDRALRDRRDGTGGVPRARGGERTVGGPGAGLGAIMTWLLWGAVAVAVVLIVLMIVRELARTREGKVLAEAGGGAEEQAVVPGAALDRPLDDADRLAREGRYAEAIHVLLLRTLQELARAASVRIASSWTSREILARIPVRPGAQEALVELVRVVELTWFGDDVPGETEWLRCRAQFDRFVTAYHEGRAAA